MIPALPSSAGCFQFSAAWLTSCRLFRTTLLYLSSHCLCGRHGALLFPVDHHKDQCFLFPLVRHHSMHGSAALY